MMAQKISERLRECAFELATIAEVGPREVNAANLSKVAADLLRLADQVSIGELIDPRR